MDLGSEEEESNLSIDLLTFSSDVAKSISQLYITEKNELKTIDNFQQEFEKQNLLFLTTEFWNSNKSKIKTEIEKLKKKEENYILIIDSLRSDSHVIIFRPFKFGGIFEKIVVRWKENYCLQEFASLREKYDKYKYTFPPKQLESPLFIEEYKVLLILFKMEIDIPLETEKLLQDFQFNEKIKNIEQISDILFVLKKIAKKPYHPASLLLIIMLFGNEIQIDSFLSLVEYHFGKSFSDELSLIMIIIQFLFHIFSDENIQIIQFRVTKILRNILVLI
eukprot:gene4044-7333_t